VPKGVIPSASFSSTPISVILFQGSPSSTLKTNNQTRGSTTQLKSSQQGQLNLSQQKKSQQNAKQRQR